VPVPARDPLDTHTHTHTHTRTHTRENVSLFGYGYGFFLGGSRLSLLTWLVHYTTCNCAQYGGLAGPHAVIATILHSFLAMGVVSVLWVIFGFSLAFGEDDGHG
jgi:hypothetical protein